MITGNKEAVRKQLRTIKQQIARADQKIYTGHIEEQRAGLDARRDAVRKIREKEVKANEK